MQPKYRTISISDIHLGSRGCKADLLCKAFAPDSSLTTFDILIVSSGVSSIAITLSCLGISFEVVLTTGYGDLRARTDVRGVATFEALQPMETALQVRKVGLTAITVPVTVRGGEQTVEIRMVAATLLGEVRVAANAAPVARLAAVEERRRLGLPNAAFSTEELEATGSSALSLVLRRVPGVRIVDSSGVAVALSSRGERFSRGAMVPCVLRVMVDGVFMNSLTLMGLVR
jgi:hypothetical protein